MLCKGFDGGGVERPQGPHTVSYMVLELISGYAEMKIDATSQFMTGEVMRVGVGGESVRWTSDGWEKWLTLRLCSD